MKKIRASEKGLALIVTLFITAILVTVITELVYTIHIHSMTTESFRDNQRASILAIGGVELAKGILSEMSKDKEYTYYTFEEPRRFFFDNGTALRLRIEDEAAKLNLNSIFYMNGQTNSENLAVYSRLLEIAGLKKNLAHTIGDWIDANNEPRVEGAETYDYYSLQIKPYVAKGNHLDSLEELLLIKGYSPNVYRKIASFLTIYTDGRININTAPKEVLMALSSDVTDDLAERLIKYRNKYIFKNTAQIRNVPGFETIGFGLQGKITVKSHVYRIFSMATVENGSKEVEAVIDISNTTKIPYWRER